MTQVNEKVYEGKRGGMRKKLKETVEESRDSERNQWTY